MNRRKWLGVVLSVTMLSGLLGQTVAASGENGWQYVDGFTDKTTGRTYYNVRHRNGNQYDFRVVYEDKTGDWHALPQGYRWLTDSLILKWNGVFSDTPTELVYDPASDSVTRETVYTSSQNGKWGYHELTYYKLGPENPYGRWTQKFTSYTIADYATGKVKYWMDTNRTSILYWTPENKLLTMRYSEKAKQNEIVLYDPATGIANRLVLASLIGYNDKTDKMEIEYNEPTRRDWLYDLKTGKKTALTGEEANQFLLQSRSAPSNRLKPAAVPPSNLQPDQLPVTAAKETLRPAATATINGKTVALPSCYLLNNRSHIPIEPLVDAFGVQVERQTDSLGGKTFTLTNDGHSLTISDEAVYGNRLFLTKDQLEKLGLHLEALQWQPHL